MNRYFIKIIYFDVMEKPKMALDCGIKNLRADNGKY